MADLILEFGCESCYLQDKVMVCHPNCTRKLKPIDLSPLYDSIPLLDNFYCRNTQTSFTVPKDFFYGKRMPDVYRYDLICNHQCGWILCEPNNTHCAGDWKTTTINDYPPVTNSLPYKKPIENDDEAKNILIILESPHKEEYHYPDISDMNNSNFTALQPANGATGINFYKYFTSDILKYPHEKNATGTLEILFDKDATYRICFVNPVPFQASLHYILSDKGQKTKIGINEYIRDSVWERLYEECKSDFIRRVDLYKPFIILNACTGDINEKKSLKSQVKDTIKNLCQHQFYATHPSSWSRKINNRYCKKC
ncbi:hypothetical protein BCS42_01810 [Crenothrix sp. D3]|nr:hypothetical protein BCS42_01810 [Crenothrix sp. D3]